MARHNLDIAAIFDEIADLLEIENDNPYRIRAYRNASRTIRALSEELNDMLLEGRDLTALPGIGKDLAARIKEILETGHTRVLDTLQQKIPVSVEELLRLPGLGPRRVRQLYHELGIQGLEQLEAAAANGQLRLLKGFGEKTEQKILQNIHSLRSKSKRFLFTFASAEAGPLLDFLKRQPGVSKAVIAGSYRRGKETVGDIDILVSAGDPIKLIKRFVGYGEAGQIVSQGPTRSSVILHSGIQVDLRVVKDGSFGAALYYFTGSKAHNIKIRRLARQKGLKINEYGVYRGDHAVAGDTEESLFKSLGLPFIPAELREDRGEIRAARTGRLPRLIEPGEIRGDLHVHTLATDGQAGIRAMAVAARRSGLNYLAITDHSRLLAVTHGLGPEQLLRQMDEIDRLNASIHGISLLKGVEVDILEDGGLDLPDTVLRRLDLVVGAVHSHFQLNRKKQTERLLRAMDHRYFSILAHPTGRLLFERQPYDVDMGRIIDGAAGRGCFLELNCQPQRLDLNDVYCQQARAKGVLISINSDAHAERDFENLSLGINQARRGWLEKDDVLNTRSLRDLKRLLRQTMA